MLRSGGLSVGGSSRPLLPFGGDSSARGLRPPSPSKQGKGRGWVHRAQAAGWVPSGSGLVLLVPLLFFSLAVIACVWLLHGAMTTSTHAPVESTVSVQTTSIRPSRRSLLPPVQPQRPAPTPDAAAGRAFEATNVAPAEQPQQARLPSLLESSLKEIEAAPAPPRRPQSVEQSLRWLSHWLSLRASMDALSIDLRTHFPAPVAPEPLRIMAPLPRGQVRIGLNANAGTAKLFHPPPRPQPPLQGWAAGLPAFPELFLRDSLSAFLLLFPLPRPVTRHGGGEATSSASSAPSLGYEGVWDLRPLMGDATGSSPRSFPFASLLDAHPSVASTALDDLLRMRTVLRVAARTQGTRIDARTGEEVGKIAHQLPGADMVSPAPHGGAGPRNVVRNTRYASADSTALYVLGVVHYFHVSSDLTLLDELLPSLAAALAYMSRHVEAATGLVREHPAKFLASSSSNQAGASLDYALKVTYWKDSVLAKRNTKSSGGGPAFPVSYFLLQAQTLAALRALRSMRAALASFSPTDAGAAGGEAGVPMAALLRRWDDMLAANVQPDLDALIALVRQGMHSYYFRRPPSDDLSSSTSGSRSETPSRSDFPPPTPRAAVAGSCPLFGIDQHGSLGLDLDADAGPAAAAGMRSTHSPVPDQLRTSDFVHGLYYLQRDDVSSEELDAWLPEPPSAAQQQQNPAAPWEPSCFQGLETPLGYASSDLDRTPTAPAESQPTPRRGGGGGDGDERVRLSDANRALNYHHRALWPMEQAFIHSAARRFRLRHVERVAGRFFHGFERALKRNRAANPDALDPFSEYLLPRPFASRPTSAQLASGQSLTFSSGDGGGPRATAGGAGGEEWVSQGAHNQLWTGAAWSYWIAAQSERAHVLASPDSSSLQTDALALPPTSQLRTSSSNRCAVDASAVLRGVPWTERARYCPSASTLPSSAPASAVGRLPSPVSSASAAPPAAAWPASLFTCLDGSALLWLSSVNDDYCDCVDGSDERGTNACARSDEEHSFQAPTFECHSGAGRGGVGATRISVSMVDDGVCDCCDGSDEASGVVQCANTCAATAPRKPRTPIQSAWQI